MRLNAAAVRRQGDVLLIPTTRRPTDRARRVTDQGRVILAYGEVTGHAHEVIGGVLAVQAAPDGPTVIVPADPDPVPACELFEEPNGTRLLVLARPGVLRHEEHAPTALDGGSRFEIRPQVEWSLDDVRAVAD